MKKSLTRCSWANSTPQMQAYHDDEWGIPVHDSRALWEKLMLDGFQDGIGLAIVKALTAEGVHVTVPGRNQAKLDAALAGLQNVTGIVADPGTAEGAASLILQVPDTDILVNNLGIYEPKEFAEITDAN